jgi:TPR repeat protein
MATDEVRNMAGGVHGHVVQAGSIEGGIHIGMGATAVPADEQWSSTGRPVAEWTARELGVHDAVAVEPHESGDPPCYVLRRHDQEIRELLRQTTGRSLMVVLVGSSAAGKTRAAYEAVRATTDLVSWLVVRPAGPSHFRALLAGGAPQRCVLWLDDAQRRFLDPVHGGQVAEGLIRILAGPGPVLIVADMWPEHWTDLRQERSTNDADWRAPVRALLDRPQVRMIAVAGSFAEASPQERDELERCARRDPRLALALRTAGPGLEITQVLSGGPQLLRRYTDHQLEPHAHAIISVAMDARRLGLENPVTAEVLRCAAEGYLNDRSRVVADGWFSAALAEATRRHHGVAALTPVRSRPGLGAADGYVLHDFLDYHARDARANQRPPASLWSALADHHRAALEDLTRLAAEAWRRSLYRLAARFAVPAAESGDHDAMRMIARLLELRGETACADLWRERAGNPAGLVVSGQYLRALRAHLEPGKDELRSQAETGDRGAMRQLAELEHLTGHAEEAVTWARYATEGGDTGDMMFLAEVLEDAGREAEAEKLLSELAKAGYPDAMWRLAFLFEGQNRDDEALVWWWRNAETGNAVSMSHLITRLRRRGREQEAEALLRSHANAGDPDVMWMLADWLANRNQVTEAIGWFQRSAEQSPLAVNLLVDRLQELGRLEAAEAPLRPQAEDGNPSAIEELAGLLERLGRIDEATNWLRALTEDTPRGGLPRSTPTESTSLRKLMELLRRTGRTAEADQLRAYGIEPGGATAAPWELLTQPNTVHGDSP